MTTTAFAFLDTISSALCFFAVDIHLSLLLMLVVIWDCNRNKNIPRNNTHYMYYFPFLLETYMMFIVYVFSWWSSYSLKWYKNLLVCFYVVKDGIFGEGGMGAVYASIPSSSKYKFIRRNHRAFFNTESILRSVRKLPDHEISDLFFPAARFSVSW